MAVTEQTWEDALLLVASVRSALVNQTKHYDKDGRLLRTEREIMEALLTQKSIRLDVSKRIEITTDEEQLELVRREFQNVKSKYIK